MSWQSSIPSKVLRLAAASAIALAVVMPIGANAQNDYRYALFDMGVLGNDTSSATAINEQGVVVGLSQFTPKNACFHAVAWRRGVLRDIDRSPACTSVANDISEEPAVVGQYHFPDGGHAAMWLLDGTILDLGTLGGDFSEANAVNNLGEVTGTSEVTPGTFDLGGFLWRNGSMIDIGALGSSGAYPNDMNDLTQIVGSSRIAGNTSHAFLWENGVMIDLGVLPGTGNTSVATGVNNRGQIVGRSQVGPFTTHAFLWDKGVLMDIHDEEAAESSYAWAINDLGVIVGHMTLYGGETAGFIRENGRMLNLNDVAPPNRHWNIDLSTDINDAGQIVGYDDLGLFDTRGVILTPVNPTLDLSPPTPGVAGQVNRLQVASAPPGAHVYFIYGRVGGGAIIPGCDLQQNALQIEKPKIAGSAIADSSGVATLDAFVPDAARSTGDILIQAVVPSSCIMSELRVVRFE